MTSAFQKMTDAELDAALADLERQADELRALDLKLDMARGKPSPEQTALSRPMLDLLTSQSDLTDNGADADNYGAPDGLPSARALAAELLVEGSRGLDGDVLVPGGDVHAVGVRGEVARAGELHAHVVSERAALHDHAQLVEAVAALAHHVEGEIQLRPRPYRRAAHCSNSSGMSSTPEPRKGPCPPLASL